MSGLRVGAPLDGKRVDPPLAGTWSVWSQAGETPGGYFLAPSDDTARAMGLKYAVVRAREAHTDTSASIELIRTDPPRADLQPTKTKTRTTRRSA